MKQKIKRRDLRVKDIFIIDKAKKNKVDHLKFSISNEDGMCIIATYPDYHNALTISREYMKLHYGKSGISVRLPGILKDYVGKIIDVYECTSIESDRELFRIKPIDFGLNKISKRGRPNNIDFPYFMESGFCYVPRNYINNNFDEKLIEPKISFDKTDLNSIKNGIIFARVDNASEIESVSYPLYRYSKGLRTRPMKQLLNLTKAFNKKLENFKFLSKVHDDKTGHDVIAFQESING